MALLGTNIAHVLEGDTDAVDPTVLIIELHRLLTPIQDLLDTWKNSKDVEQRNTANALLPDIAQLNALTENVFAIVDGRFPAPVI